MAVEGIELIEELKFKKDRLGRPFISAYQEKLKLLEDLQKNKYINPKTGKKFTPKEWLDASATTRSKYRDPKSFLQKKKEYQKKYMAEKKKDPAYKKEFLKKKKDEYFKTVDKKYKVDKGAGKAILQIQDNKLLGYLLTAANKQKKNLKGDAKPQFEEVIKNKKFVGVKDNKTGITYHHARYKGTLGVNDRLITDHPQFNKIKDLTKIADGFKRSLPNATIASYFAKYDRVPTNAELYNFLSKDPDLVSKYSAQAMASNPLELHHRLGVEVAPDKSLQLTPRVKNNTAGVIVEEFKKGNISKDEAAKQLKKINVRVKLPGTKSYIGAKDIAPTQAVGAAKREVSKMFLERVKEDPNVVNEIVDAFALKVKSIPGGCRAVVTRALGGPIDKCEVIIKADPERAALKLNNAITATKGPLKDLKEDSQKLIRLYRGEGFKSRSGPTIKELAKTFNVSEAEAKKKLLSGQWFTSDPVAASSYTDKFGKTKFVDVTPKEFMDFKRYVERVNKTKSLSGGERFPVGTQDKLSIVPRYKLKEFEEAGKLKSQRNIFKDFTTKSGYVDRPEGVLSYDSVKGGFVDPAQPDKVVTQSDIKQYAIDNPMEVKVGEPAKLPKPNKSVLKTVGKTLAAVGAPLPTALLDGYFIGKQVQEGKSTAEIASNPLNWLGLATMSPLTRVAGLADKSGKLSSVLRLGLNPGTISGISRFAGLPGLAISTAVTAYDQYNKYKNQEGFIYKLFNKEES